MPDHPIIFSAPMIRALLAGTKTQTRRLAWRADVPAHLHEKTGTPSARIGSSPWQRVRPGDRLWVRENFWHAPVEMGFDRTHGGHGHVAYSAGPGMGADADDRARAYGVKQRPSIHMPRWASRLTLHVEAVRVERLQDMSLADAIAEGAPLDPEYVDRTSDGSGPPMVKIGCASWMTPRAWFHDLWDTLHGPGAWEANPEVVVLTFRVERRNIDA